MRQARWSERGIELVEADPPPLRDGWVRLRVTACGICGSDLHLYRREFSPTPGMVPGHEVVGFPLDGPAGLAERLYAVEPRLWCGTCGFCLSGRRHLCPEGRILGLTEAGGLGEFMDAPREVLHRIDPDVPEVVASMSEPVAVCVRALHRARIEAGSRVLVLGGGTIGLTTALLARDRSVEVGITVRYPHQREAARKLGLEPLGEAEAEAWSRDRAPDVVVETVGGTAETLAQAVELCRAAGRIVVLGIFSGERPVNAMLLMAKGLTLVGSNTYGTDRRGAEFRAAVELMPRYREEIAALQTHRFALNALAEAFRCAADKRSGAIKVTVLPDAGL